MVATMVDRQVILMGDITPRQVILMGDPTHSRHLTTTEDTTQVSVLCDIVVFITHFRGQKITDFLAESHL